MALTYPYTHTSGEVRFSQVIFLKFYTITRAHLSFQLVLYSMRQQLIFISNQPFSGNYNMMIYY